MRSRGLYFGTAIGIPGIPGYDLGIRPATFPGRRSPSTIYLAGNGASRNPTSPEYTRGHTHGIILWLGL